MAPAVTSRPLNPVEQKIHQACSAIDKKMLGQKEIDVLVPDVNVRVSAINFLLSTGMLKMMAQDGGKQISYKAVMKKEVEIKKEMGGDENMVLNHIQSAGNEGIWTKHLKGKTELHQTIINRCLKSLEQKGLIKAVKSVKYPTRKIYMMSHLEPSVEVTGGPWYSENELDTEFIQMLASACLRFIQDKSYPKSTFSWDTGAPSASAAPLFPISRSLSYPTSSMIHSWLQKSNLSEQELGVEHVEMLLDTLVFDGEIERLPAYGASLWQVDALDEDSEEERKEKRRKKREKKGKTEQERKKKAKGKKRARKDGSSEDDEEEDARRKKRRKVKEESDDSGDHKRKSKSEPKARTDSENASDSDSDSENHSDPDSDRKRSKRRKKKKSTKSSRSNSKSKFKRRSSSLSSSSDSDAESVVSKSSSKSRKKKRNISLSKSSKKKHMPALDDSDSSDMEEIVTMGAIGSANVYRAVRQERVSLGWSQATCGRCPVFDFCHESGPVNPKECTYYGDWLQQGVAEF